MASKSVSYQCARTAASRRAISAGCRASHTGLASAVPSAGPLSSAMHPAYHDAGPPQIPVPAAPAVSQAQGVAEENADWLRRRSIPASMRW